MNPIMTFVPRSQKTIVPHRRTEPPGPGSLVAVCSLRSDPSSISIEVLLSAPVPAQSGIVPHRTESWALSEDFQVRNRAWDFIDRMRHPSSREFAHLLRVEWLEIPLVEYE